MRDLKANRLLERNIDAMLSARGQTRHDLAFYCRRSDAWISKIFTDDENEKRGLPLKYLDRIADFFGIATYQLFQPGISGFTERRKGMERRTGSDRRIGRTELMRRPVTTETLSPRVAEIVWLAEQLQGTAFDEMVHWAQAQLVRQGLQPGGVLHVDPRRTDGAARARSARTRKA